MLKIPATIEAINSRVDGTWSLKIGTQELNEASSVELMKLRRALGWFVFAVTEHITEADIPTDIIEFKDDKPLDERLNAVLFAYWMKKTNNAKDFHTFKRTVYESLIDKYKEKLSEMD